MEQEQPRCSRYFLESGSHRILGHCGAKASKRTKLNGYHTATYYHCWDHAEELREREQKDIDSGITMRTVDTWDPRRLKYSQLVPKQ